ncbi:MAG: hypothetical protein O2829_07155 [Bacteroidetes bacterium]|nr:hypothetical protein [Bacteroidota bacterium]
MSPFEGVFREAYSRGNWRILVELSKIIPCFRQLKEVYQAHLDRLYEDPTRRRPEKVILQILERGTQDFDRVFSLFIEREGIYGFGDIQVWEGLDLLKHEVSR